MSVGDPEDIRLGELIARRVGPDERAPGFAYERVAGVPLAVADLDDAVNWVIDNSQGKLGAAVHFCNAHTLSLADRDPVYRAGLLGSTLLLADGQWVAWVAWVLTRGRSRLRKVSGPDFFEALLAASLPGHPKHYLLGGSPETLRALCDSIERRYPAASVVGSEAPPFRELSNEERTEQDRRICDSGADIVWVGLGTPKQDWEAIRLHQRLGVTAVAVGAAFDFSAGTKKRAPDWMRRSGLEWLHRLAREPERLWRRYLVGNAIFLWGCVRR